MKPTRSLRHQPLRPMATSPHLRGGKLLILSLVVIILGIFVSVRKLRATDFQTIAESGNKKIKIGNFVVNDECQMSNDECQLPNENGNNNNSNINSENSNINTNSNGNINENSNPAPGDAGQVENENINSDVNTNSNSNINENTNTNNNDNSEPEIIFPDFTINLPERVKAGEEFGISVSSDGNLDDFDYFWDKDENDYELSPEPFGTGQAGGEEPTDLNFEFEGREVTLQYLKPGNYTIVLEVRDDKGNSSRQRAVIDVSNPDLSGQIKISAVLPNPLGVDNASKPNGEVVWLSNQSDLFVDVSGWVLYDTESTHELFITSENISGGVGLLIPPGGEVKVFRNGDSDFSLNNEGDTVRLYSGPVEMMGGKQDEIVYSVSQEGKIYERNLESGEWSVQSSPSLSMFSDLGFTIYDLRKTFVSSSPSFQKDKLSVSSLRMRGSSKFDNRNILFSKNNSENENIGDLNSDYSETKVTGSSVKPRMTREEKSIFQFLSNSFVAYASEITQIISENFEGFTLERELLPGENAEQKFFLENEGETLKEVYLKSSLNGDITRSGEENIFKNLFLEIKEGENCLFGCGDKISLFDLREDPKIILEMTPANREELTLYISLGNEILSEEIGKEIQFSLSLMEEITSGNDPAPDDAGQAPEPENDNVVNNNENGNTNSESSDDLPLPEASDGQSNVNTNSNSDNGNTNENNPAPDDAGQAPEPFGTGQAKNESINDNDNGAVASQEGKTISLVKPDNLKSGKEKKDAKHKEKNNHETRDKFQETRNKSPQSSDGAKQTNSPAGAGPRQGGGDNQDTSTEAQEPSSSGQALNDEDNKIILSAKKQDPVKSFWSFFTGMGFLTKMFFLWMVVWVGLFGVFWWKRGR